MAWMCPKCEKRIFTPRSDNRFTYVLRWAYVKKSNDLKVDLKNLQDIKSNQVITHLHCEYPEQAGFTIRMKRKLKMPLDREHPLLFDSVLTEEVKDV